MYSTGFGKPEGWNLSFGRRLREARDRLRLTQEQFAELGGVKRVSQHLYEQDARVPDLNYLLRLKEHGVDVAHLVLGDSASQTSATHNPVDLYVAAFRTVDEFARDNAGNPLPYAERERFFSFLCTTLSQTSAPESGTELKERLVRFMRA